MYAFIIFQALTLRLLALLTGCCCCLSCSLLLSSATMSRCCRVPPAVLPVGSSQVDYIQGLSGVEFPPPWGGCWNGLAEGKRGKRTEANGSFRLEEVDLSGSLVYKDYKEQVKDLDQIRVLVDNLGIKIEALLQNADFALREGVAMEIAIDEIKKKLSDFMQTIENLSSYADKCSRDVRRARTMILHKMITYPST